MNDWNDVITNILGNYEPCYLYDQATGELLDSSINWGYIAQALILIVCIWFIFKTIGGLIYEWLR